jgi:hypothetical protein
MSVGLLNHPIKQLTADKASWFAAGEAQEGALLQAAA